MCPAPRIGFLFSTEVGLRTQYENWRSGLEALAPALTPEWIVIEWYKEGGTIERLPRIPWGLKARWRSQSELQAGLRRGPFDSLLIGAPSVIYSHSTFLARQPYSVTIDCTPRQLNEQGALYGKQPTPLRWYEEAKERWRAAFFQNAQALFPWSEWAARSMIDDYGADPSRVQIVPPGVDLTRWALPPRPLTPTIQLLFVGGDFVRKGGDLLLDWAQHTTATNWKLHLVTRDAPAIPHPRIQVYRDLAPNSPELIALYRQAHLFVLPTRGDCYSIAGIEALASGLPVLLGDVGGIRDIVRDGETGYLLPRESASALAQRLDGLLANPTRLRAMGEAARCDAAARFDQQKNITRVLETIAPQALSDSARAQHCRTVSSAPAG